MVEELEEEDDSCARPRAEPWFGLYREGKAKLTNYG
jgi:hypothetical protein